MSLERVLIYSMVVIGLTIAKSLPIREHSSPNGPTVTPALIDKNSDAVTNQTPHWIEEQTNNHHHIQKKEDTSNSSVWESEQNTTDLEQNQEDASEATLEDGTEGTAVDGHRGPAEATMDDATDIQEHHHHNNIVDAPGGAIVDKTERDHQGSDGQPTTDTHEDHGMMKMFFHASDSAIILFENWKSKTWQGMLGSCVAVAVVAALFEGFKVARELLADWSCMSAARRGTKVMNNYELRKASTSELVGDEGNSNNSNSSRIPVWSSTHVLQTALHFVQVLVGYSLMLVFMTYNVWLCLALSAGSALGYFCFAWLKTPPGRVMDRNDACH